VVETVALGAATGRLLAADVTASAPLPRFAAAAMDGWALAPARPTPAAGPADAPLRWLLGDAIAAGDSPATTTLQPGTARPISTGAVVPAGAVAVLRAEQGDVTRDSAGRLWLSPRHPVRDGDHIRPAGEEAAAGDVLLRAPITLTPPRIALAAAAGRDSLTVRRLPSMDVLILGDELVRSGVPGGGAIRDLLGPTIPGIGANLGLRDGEVREVTDSLAATVAALQHCSSDVVVTTGGSSHGAADHMRRALATLGARMVFDGVRMRPGHPVMLAELPDGRPVLSLPGNPLAAFICLASFGVPLADAMLGRPARPLDVERMAGAVPPGTGSTRLVACQRDPSGLSPVTWQGSSMVRGLADADVVAVVPVQGVAAGARVQTLPLPW
ncbi:MAG: molybdopterin molybdotransferase MoeA, partial [Glaciihabitans sp.]